MATEFVPHPITGGLTFGQVPPCVTRGVHLPGGEIRLLIGRHIGPNHGYGLRHIWAEHAKEMAAAGITTSEGVGHYVALIIRPGTPLFYSGDSFRKTRLMAVRSATGTAILEWRDQRDMPFWSVVTAYSANKKHGSLIGTVL
ncbi:MULTISPECIES: hypothetical protein [unclassified Rhizobium]|uniref:hypothetical protein n=1 Tax=unclassified Rhizobium TaxID=2613769 RepID=UPI0016031D29|nr:MULTISPECIES: hypothetical protein [unclassified Rhizobium]MBB1248524.1 hypothetical protein [Rhizobium sp. G21]MCV3766540.1 hypothetical protein [Rhizobium sp. TRM95796]